MFLTQTIQFFPTFPWWITWFLSTLIFICTTLSPEIADVWNHNFFFILIKKYKADFGIFLDLFQNNFTKLIYFYFLERASFYGHLDTYQCCKDLTDVCNDGECERDSNDCKEDAKHASGCCDWSNVAVTWNRNDRNPVSKIRFRLSGLWFGL